MTVTSPKSGLRGKLQLSMNTGTTPHGSRLGCSEAPRGQGWAPGACWMRPRCHGQRPLRGRLHPAAASHLLLLLGRPSFYFRINLPECMHFLCLLKEKIDI